MKNQIEDSFEDWIIKQISPELKEQLQQTPYYTQKPLTIEQTVTLYIQHQPVPIKGWFANYDPKTAQHLRPTIKGKKQNLGTPQANKYYVRHKQLKKKKQTEDSFQDWVLSQISEKTKKTYLELERDKQ